MQTVTIKNNAITILRYALGVIMFAYGLIKILQLQFVLPQEAYHIPLNQLDGVTLAWAFLGFSPWLSILLGAFELIPGVLLLFKKTKLLGAILLVPSLVTVFLINIAYNFLPHMKVLTAMLLLMDLIILYPYRRLLASFLKGILLHHQLTWKEMIVNTIIFALATFFILFYFK